MVNVTTCLTCGLLVDGNESSTHNNFHASLPSMTPCMICGAAVSLYQHQEHQRFHDRVAALETLVGRLVGDIEAHLEFLSK